MADTFARMRQLSGSTLDWAANDLVIGLGEIAVERASASDVRMKVGDGASRYSALPYTSAGASSVPWDQVTGKPATFPPATHTHPPSQVTGLVDAGGKLTDGVMPQKILDKMFWKGMHTPTGAQEYPLAPVVGDTWGISGPPYTFTGGALAGKTVGQGSAITYGGSGWAMVGGGAGLNPADYVAKADLIEISAGPSSAGRVPKTNANGRLDPSLINVPGSLVFRGTVDITQPPPTGVNVGDYWLVGIGGAAHAGWTGIAGTTMQVNDTVIWNGVVWTYTRATGAASGFLPIDGSAPMTGPLSLSANPSPVPAHAVRRDYLDTRIAAIPSAISQLGFTPLNPANNLSELTDKPAARGNLGLGTAATAAAADFLAKVQNLNDLADKALSRSNLGLGTAAVQPDNYWLKTASNLADIPDKAAARANLGVSDPIVIPAGVILDFAGTGTTPNGWYLCDGSVKSQTTDAALFAAIGTTYNTGGEGAGNFRLPDLRGYVRAGVGNMGGVESGRLTPVMISAVNSKAGAATHMLTVAELAQHAHNVGADNFRGIGAGSYGGSNAGGASINYYCSSTGDFAGGYQGSNIPHNNTQPTIQMNAIIKR